MTDSPRCDVCKVKATLAPKTLLDVLAYLAPPLALLDAIERWDEKAPGKVDQSILAYRQKWIALRAGDPVPQVDKFEQPAQAELIRTAKYE